METSETELMVKGVLSDLMEFGLCFESCVGRGRGRDCDGIVACCSVGGVFTAGGAGGG
jgi:hypothetical protein